MDRARSVMTQTDTHLAFVEEKTMAGPARNYVLIKVDGKNSDSGKPFSKLLRDNDIIVYAHEFQSIRTYFRRRSHIKINTSPYKSEKDNIYGVWGTYRKARWNSTEAYDAMDLRHLGWGMGSLGSPDFAGIPGTGMAGDVIASGLLRALTTQRYFVALTQYDWVQPLHQKFIYGQDHSEVFLVASPPTTFGEVYDAIIFSVRVP